MVRDANSDHFSDIEHTIFTIDPGSKQISSECPSSDDASEEVKKREYNDRATFIGGGSLNAYEPTAEYEGRYSYNSKAQ
jgi:hypothetical protein